ncbi:UNVERIFIED_ORG: hypothetical protein J2X79_003720 [Arthrobacter globiformis]|nr:hypothetical protein [Arthrobacter globiformis]
MLVLAKPFEATSTETLCCIFFLCDDWEAVLLHLRTVETVNPHQLRNVVELLFGVVVTGLVSKPLPDIPWKVVGQARNDIAFAKKVATPNIFPAHN